MTAPCAGLGKRFAFERDTFAFRHELVWNYTFDAVTGAMTVRRVEPPPTYYHRCFVVVRAARLFFDYARFCREMPRADASTYRRLVRQVIASNPRKSCSEKERIVFPGFDGLRAFSQEHEHLLKAECGAAWESYFLRSHWRMVFPVSAEFQAGMADKLVKSLRGRGLALVHLFRFPRITINHGIALFDLREFAERLEFAAYDPNLPEHPVTLVYDKAARQFTLAANIYWGGGPVSVMEIYCDWPY